MSSHPDTTAADRPPLVTAVVALTVIGGVVTIGAGIVAMTVSRSAFGGGLVPLLTGLIYLGVARGLWTGSASARVVVAVVSAIQLIVAVLTVISSPDGTTRSTAIASAVVGVVILVVLFSPGANAFFAARQD